MRRLFQSRALKLVIEGSETLEWFVRDNSKVLMKIDAGHNFIHLLENESITDAMPLAKYLESQTGAIAVDVGANRGYVTVALARNFDKVFAFEPDNKNRNSLEETLLNNAINNVTIVEAALSVNSNPAMLRVSNSHGHHTLEVSHLTNVIDSVQVNTVRFDEFTEVQNINNVDIVKIDVEGHELSVLKGFGKMLHPHIVKKIVFEHSLSLSKVQGKNECEVIDFLNAAGYAVHTLSGEFVSRDGITSIKQADLVAVPSFQYLQTSE